ncbi:phage holin family protein [bacterium]|nr:phage holin family protein [bacterium]
MLRLLVRWVLSALIIMLTAHLVPGITIVGFSYAMLAVVVMAVVNAFIKPILMFISLPANILTLGLFTFVINALLFMLVAYITPGFSVQNFWAGLAGSLVVAILLVPVVLFTEKKKQ